MNPVVVALQIIAFCFAVYHSITWFNLTPKAMVFWNGEEKVSPALIAGANYFAWLVISAVVFILVS